MSAPSGADRIAPGSDETRVGARWFWLLSLGVVALALALRLPHLESRSLWYDESRAANNARDSFAQMLSHTRLNDSVPILPPLLNFAIQKVSRSVLALRVPSLIASLLVVIATLWGGRKLLGERASLLAALLLAVSSSQIRYAQEARNYALGVLVATAMTLSYLAFSARPSGSRERWTLFAFLALAPLIQYSLILYGLMLLAALAWSTRSNTALSIKDLVVTASGFAATAMFSVVYTLKYQWNDNLWYLAPYFFTPGKSSIAKFLVGNSVGFLTFVTPGQMGFALVLFGLVYVLVGGESTAALARLLVVAFLTSVGVAALHLFPFGGIRQCIYLAPVFCFATAVGVQGMSAILDRGEREPGQRLPLDIPFIVPAAAVVLISGAYAIRSDAPYAETEDARAVVAKLSEQPLAGSDVYVFWGARPGVSFYLDQDPSKRAVVDRMQVGGDDKWTEPRVIDWQGTRYIYGCDRVARFADYAHDATSLGRPGARLFLVFAHLRRAEDVEVGRELRKAGYQVEELLHGTDAVLLQATPP